MNNELKHFLPYQPRWILDPVPLKLTQKSRPIGIHLDHVLEEPR